MKNGVGLRDCSVCWSSPTLIACIALRCTRVALGLQSQQQASNYQISNHHKVVVTNSLPCACLYLCSTTQETSPPFHFPSSSRQDAEDSCPIVADDTLLYLNLLSLPQTVSYVSSLASQGCPRAPEGTVCLVPCQKLRMFSPVPSVPIEFGDSS